MKNPHHLATVIDKDIDEYEKKAILGMTLKQLIWVLIAVLVCFLTIIPFMLLGLNDIGYIFGFTAAFIVFFIGGFKKWHGRDYSDFVKAWWKYYRNNQVLTYYDESADTFEIPAVSLTKQDRKINANYQEVSN